MIFIFVFRFIENYGIIGIIMKNQEGTMKKIKISGGMLVFLGALCWSLNAPLIKFIDTDALLIL